MIRIKNFFSKPTVKWSLIILGILCGILLIIFLIANIVWFHWYNNTFLPKTEGLKLSEYDTDSPLEIRSYRMLCARDEERGIDKTLFVYGPLYPDRDYQLSLFESLTDLNTFLTLKDGYVYLADVFCWPERDGDNRYGISLVKRSISTVTDYQLYTDTEGNIIRPEDKDLPEEWQIIYEELLPAIRENFKEMEKRWGNLDDL